MKLIKALLLILVSSYAYAEGGSRQLPSDTSKVVVRSFDQHTLERFKSDSAFRYGRPQQGLTPLQRFWLWFGSWVARLIFFVSQTLVGRIIFYSLCGVVILYILLKVLDVDARDLFYRSSTAGKIGLKLSEENIHALDFEKLIQEAVERRAYRNAVRLIFLFSLRKLSEADLIHWSAGKTNDEYLLELQKHPSRSCLIQLIYYFDYTWYGNFEINSQTFASVNKAFEEFKTHIK